jgi:hypothetical protein
MGTLSYGNQQIEFEDRVLAHLQLVLGSKLRRQESFFMSWKETADTGAGRTTLWINPFIPMAFRYRGDTMPGINRAWLEELTASANSAQGLMLSDETSPHP